MFGIKVSETTSNDEEDVLCRQLERFISTPPLVRETSRYHMVQRLRNALGFGAPSGVSFDKAMAGAERSFSDIVLAPSVKHEVRTLAASAANTRLHGAPFRHFLFYGTHNMCFLSLLCVCCC